MVLTPSTDNDPVDRTVTHDSPICFFPRIEKAFYLIAWNRVPNSVVNSDPKWVFNLAVDADDFTVECEEGASGVAGIHRGIDLNRVGVCFRVTVESADNAERGCGLVAWVGIDQEDFTRADEKGIAERDHRLPHFRAGRVAER